MRKQSLHTRKNVFLWLILPFGAGLLGLTLIRSRKPKSKANSFDVLNNTKYSGMKDFIIAQSKVESANYTSPLFMRSNNAFGMKNAFTRTQLGSEEYGTDYRYYNSLTQSIQDFIMWLDFTNFPIVSDVNTYVRNLKTRSYFESDQSDYINAIESWL